MDDNLSNEQARTDKPANEDQQSAAPDIENDDNANIETEHEPDVEGAGDTGEGDAEGEPEKPKKRSGIERLKRQLAETRAENEMLRSRTPQVLDSAGIAHAVESEIGVPPKEADFANFFDYERALTAYETEKRMVTREMRKQAEQAQAQMSAREQAMLDDFRDREADAVAAIPDYRQTMEAAKALQVTEVLSRLMVESDKGPLLKYHLAKNPGELQALNALDPMSAARAIGRLEQRLSLPTANKSTKAPPPSTPPKGGTSMSGPGKSMRDYERWRSSGA